MHLDERDIEEFRAYFERETPPYLDNLNEQWPDVVACIQKIEESVVQEGTSLALSAILLGGPPIEVLYHVCLDGFVHGYELSCGQKPTDTLTLEKSPDMVMIAYVGTKKLRKLGVDVGGLLVSVEVSAILRGYFAALEQIPRGGQ